MFSAFSIQPQHKFAYAHVCVSASWQLFETVNMHQEMQVNVQQCCLQRENTTGCVRERESRSIEIKGFMK